MTFRTFTLLAILLLGFQLNAYAVNPVKVKDAERSAVLKEKGITKESLKEKLDGLTGKKRAKAEKKLDKIKKKIAKKNAKEDGEKDASGVELGLIIVLVGLLVAILGFAGVADILVTIGIVVLVVGLVLWLLKAI